MALRKIQIQDLENAKNHIPNDRWVCNPFYILAWGYMEDDKVFLRDEIYQNEFPFIGLPENKKDWQNSIMCFVSEKELEQIKKQGIKIRHIIEIEEDFYYSTQELLDLKGKENVNFRKAVNKFKNKYDHKILSDYPKDKIKEFIKQWADKQEVKNKLFNHAEEFAIFCVDNKELFPEAKWLFIEIDNKLVGYNVSIKLSNDLWIGVHQKVDYSYTGLGRFLMHERANQYKDTPFFTLGSGVDKGVKEFKESLRPIKKEKRYLIVTEN